MADNDNRSPQQIARKLHKEFAKWYDANEATFDEQTKFFAHRVKWGLYSLANTPWDAPVTPWDAPVIRRELGKEFTQLAALLAKGLSK